MNDVNSLIVILLLKLGIPINGAFIIVGILYIALAIIVIGIVASIFNTDKHTKELLETNKKIIEQNDIIIGILLNEKDQKNNNDPDIKP